MIVHVKFVAVQGRGTVEDVKNYLYDHSTVIESAESDNKVFCVIRTESADSDSRAQYLAQYQADRLRSGLYGAKVYDQPSDVLPVGADEQVWALA